MANHTPGPWRATSAGQNVRAGTVIDVAYMSRHLKSDEERKANAHLIAAAPELLEACKETLREMRAYNGESELDDSCPMKPTFDQLKAAIAKAEGKEAKDV